MIRPMMTTWERWLWMWRCIGYRRAYNVLIPGVGYRPRKLGVPSDPPDAIVEDVT